MDLVKYIENPMPLKAIPDELLNRILIGSKEDKNSFVEWISNLLSLTDRQSMDRLEYALPSIKKLCWSMSFPEIVKMFEMYADNELGIQPRSNYFNRILVGQIHDAYKSIQRTKPKTTEVVMEISEEEKKLNAYMNIIISFDNYKQERIMDRSDWTVYEELLNRKLLEHTDKQKKEVYAIVQEKYPIETKQFWIERSKINLLERLYSELITKGKHIKTIL